MIKRLLLLLFITVFITHIHAQVVTHHLIFDDNQTVIDEKQKLELDSLSELLLDKTQLVVYPLTYDENFDSYIYSKQAKLQAESIAQYAQTIGYDLRGIPVNLPSAYRGRSVRVDLFYKKPEAVISAIINPNPPKYSVDYHYPAKASQYFIIDPIRDTTLIGEEGTKLFFKAKSLLSLEKVEIELKEFYTLADYIKNDIPTTSNGRMIETGGAIFLNAKEHNPEKRAVKINPNIGVDIEFNSGKSDPDMEIFIRDPKVKNQMNWIPKNNRESFSSWQMTEYILDPDGEVISEKKFTSKAEWEAYLKEKQEIEEQKEELESYQETFTNKLKTFDLGYINCDKFINEATIEYSILADTKMACDYFLVFSETRGLLKGRQAGGDVLFGQVPQNQTAKLLVISYKDDKAYFYKTSINTANTKKPEIKLKVVSESFVDQQLSLLK